MRKGGEDLACVKRGEVGTGVQSGDKREEIQLGAPLG
jgi:hypothetical protein